MRGRYLAVPDHALEGFAKVDGAAAGLPLQVSQGVGTPLGGVAGGQSQAPPVLDGEGVAGSGGLPGLAQHVVEEG